MPQGNRKYESRGGRGRGREPKEFQEQILDLARVTRVTKGGKRMRFRATVVIGDRKGRVGYGIAKGADVPLAIGKAVRRAQKTIFRVPLVNETIPCGIREKFGAARIMLKPAPPGTGVKAGGAMRLALELAGVPNVVGKQLGSANKINNVKAVMEALHKLDRIEIPEKTKVAVTTEGEPQPKAGQPLAEKAKESKDKDSKDKE